MGDAQLGEAMAPDLAECLRRRLAQRGPGGGQRFGLMRELTDSYAHNRSKRHRYQTRTRAAGSR